MKTHAITENAKMFDTKYLGYRDEILGEIIEEAKYESVRGLISEIAEIVYNGYFKGMQASDSGKIIIVPMPTNRQHVRERSMDHMDLIAQEIERLSYGKVQKKRLLVRAKDTVQVGAKEAVRRKQAKEAVKLNPRFLDSEGMIVKEWSEKHVVLIDDVWTTGASMLEAGKILKDANVKDLVLLTITKSRARRSPTLRHGEIY
ncbi:ComF family protein [Candidatus Saccharibacteria bacterium]|nr:ComF family protein [Candidatus Saccharibacteria bacterium]